MGLATGSCMGLWISGAGKREICCWRWRQCTRRRSKWYLLTLSRTSVPGRVQPGDVTRELFLVLVREAYAAVFPAPDVLHGGPTFAYVVRELHHNHPHAPPPGATPAPRRGVGAGPLPLLGGSSRRFV